MPLKEQIDPSTSGSILHEIEHLVKKASERGGTRALRRFIARFALPTMNHWTMILCGVYRPKVLTEQEYDRYAKYGDVVLPAFTVFYTREIEDYAKNRKRDGKSVSSFLNVSFGLIKDQDGKMATSIAIYFDKQVDELTKEDMIHILGAMGSAAMVVEQDNYIDIENIPQDELVEAAKQVVENAQCWVPIIG